MKIVEEKPVKVFKREHEGNTFYSFGLSKKKQDGSYDNGYMSCQFKKGVSVENKSKIYIKDAWLSFYLKDKETKPYVFINDFETVEETIQNSKSDSEIVKDVMENKDPFAEFGDSIKVDDNLLD